MRPVTVGTVTIDPPLVLAPMAGYTNYPFRLLCREQGAGLVCSEFVSSHGLSRGMRNTWELVDLRADERPVSVQIFGAEPAVMAQAARLLEEAGADLIDINMGCWVPKVVKTGAGAALLRSPETAAAVVRAVSQAVSVPVSVKIRIGWTGNHLTGLEIARLSEDAGARMIAVHARVATQRYEGQARWDYIAEIKQAVSIPVVGNGDVRTPEDARRMFEQTGCDAVMIGRAALGNPWIFSQCRDYLTSGEQRPDPSPRERLHMARRHLCLAADSQPEAVVVREMRAHLAYYIKGFPGAAAMRERLMGATRLEEILGLLEQWASDF